MRIEMQRGHQSGDDPLRETLGFRPAQDTGLNDDEFIAAETRHDVA